MNRWVRRGLPIALALLPAWGAALTFEEALAEAQAQAPTLAAARARVLAAQRAAPPAAELPDPKLAFGIENLPVSGIDRFRLTRDFMTMQRVQLTQELPNRDKRQARAAMAQARIERAEAAGAVAALALRRETALAWIRRHAVERQLQRLQALFDENRLFDAAVRARLASRPSMAGGDRVMATDVVMPRQEEAMLAERRDELEMQRQQAIAALSRWVGPRAAEPLAGDVPAWPLERHALLQRLPGHPELRSADTMARELDAELREARSMKKPDWGVEVAYQRRGREFGDMVSVMLMVDLPIFQERRQDPQVSAKLAEREGIEAERDAMRRELTQMLDDELAMLQRLDRAVARQRDTLLPLAIERVELALGAYRGGSGSLVDVVAARRERVEIELKTIALEGERHAVAARLHHAYGMDPLPDGGPR
jgi:cobalt-zinc-cadmium efflux system outer membrane protein